MNSREGDTQARSTADAVARRSYGKLVAYLAAQTHDVSAAEDALSEAFAAALADWPVKGCPSNPEAWLMTVARRKIIDLFRGRRRDEMAAGQLQAMTEDVDAGAGGAEIPDQRLAMMFACAHPAIEAGIRAPLILQVVMGMDAKTIASAFLLSPAAMGKRLVRAQGEDPAGRNSLPRAGTRGASRPARHRPGGDLCGVCGRLERPARKRCRAPRSQRGGAVSGQAGDGAAAGGGGGAGPACTDAARRSAARAHGARRPANTCRLPSRIRRCGIRK